MIVPQAEPEQPAPETLHVTFVFEEPVTVALNCCFAPTTTFAVLGATVTTTGGIIVTVALADFVVSATEVTVTVTRDGEGITAGAVYTPSESIVPQLVPEQPVPLTLQVTLMLVVPLTEAVNRC